MTSSKERERNFYQEAKENLFSLVVETGLVFIGLAIMLVITDGNPSGWIVGISFVLGIGLVFRCENKRLVKKEQKVLIENIKIEGNFSEFFSSVNFKHAFLYGVNLNGADLNGFNLKHAFLYRANLNGAFLIDTNLNGAFLLNTKLIGANLKRANLKRANLIGALLNDANLNRANLSRANLSGANLSGASLKSANLNRANLSRANLSGANLNGASLRGTKFGNNLGISNKLRREFETRGAKFVDSPEDTAWIESPIRP